MCTERSKRCKWLLRGRAKTSWKLRPGFREQLRREAVGLAERVQAMWYFRLGGKVGRLGRGSAGVEETSSSNPAESVESSPRAYNAETLRTGSAVYHETERDPPEGRNAARATRRRFPLPCLIFISHRQRLSRPLDSQRLHHSEPL